MVCFILFHLQPLDFYISPLSASGILAGRVTDISIFCFTTSLSTSAVSMPQNRNQPLYLGAAMMRHFLGPFEVRVSHCSEAKIKVVLMGISNSLATRDPRAWWEGSHLNHVGFMQISHRSHAIIIAASNPTVLKALEPTTLHRWVLPHRSKWLMFAPLLRGGATTSLRTS